MTEYHNQLLQEDFKRRQQRAKKGHKTSTLFLNLVAAEVTGYILGRYVTKPYKKPIDRLKNGLIKKAFKL